MTNDRPDTEGIAVRLDDDTLKQLDEWIDEQPDPKPTRSVAIRMPGNEHAA